MLSEDLELIMSQPPANPYPSQPESGGPYGSYPPRQPGGYPPQRSGGYPPSQQPGGYPPHQSGGYPPPQQPGGYPPQQPGGYPPPQQPGGYPPPQRSGGYGSPQQPDGYPAAPQSGGYPSAPQSGGYPPPQTGGNFFGESGQPHAEPAKKKSTRKIVLIALSVVLVLCGGGAAVAFFALGDEVKETVDARNIRVVEPEKLAGRSKVTDPNLLDIAKQLEGELNKSLPDATSTVGAFYGDPAKKDLVMVAAASGANPNPGKTLDDTLAGAKQSDVQVGEMKSVDPGPLGGEARCGDAEAAEVPIGVCVWADKGSVGMIMVYFKTGADVQAELVTMRGQIEQKN